MRFRIIFLFAVIFLVSCNKTIIIDRKGLIDYYETQDVRISLVQKKINILVKGSGLIQKRINNLSNDKKYTIEQFASIGALIASKSIDQNINADSLSVKIENVGENSSFDYKIMDLKKTDQFTIVCGNFVNMLKTNNYENIKKYLSTDITKNLTKQNFQTILAPLYGYRKISDVKVIAFKLFKNVSGIYTNIYYEDKTAKTFIFNFKLDGQGQIAGIETP